MNSISGTELLKKDLWGIDQAIKVECIARYGHDSFRESELYGMFCTQWCYDDGGLGAALVGAYTKWVENLKDEYLEYDDAMDAAWEVYRNKIADTVHTDFDETRRYFVALSIDPRPLKARYGKKKEQS